MQSMTRMHHLLKWLLIKFFQYIHRLINQLHSGFKVPTKWNSFSIILKTSIYIQNSTQIKKLIMTCILFHFLRIIVHCLLNYIWLTNKRDKSFLYKILQINHSPLNITTSTNIQSQMIKARKAFLLVYQKSFLMLFKYTKIHLYTILYSYYNQWNKFNNL